MAKAANKRRTAPAREAPPPDPVEIFDDVEQGTEEWHALRIGVPTASVFRIIMAEGKDGNASIERARLLRTMAGEILTGKPHESYSNRYMERGREMEPRIRDRFAASRFAVLRQVGFVRRALPPAVPGVALPTRHIGCSPDSLIDEDGVLEIKSMAPDRLVETIVRGTPPPEHRAQCQGSLLVTGRRYCVLKIGYDDFPGEPEWVFERDEAYIEQIRKAVEVFEFELRQLVADVRKRIGR